VTRVNPDRMSLVRTQRAADRVAAEIRAAIVRGELTESDSLPAEAQLMARFAVSRPTLREAIRILESENLLKVSRGPRGGAKVMALNTDLVARSVGQTLQSRRATLRDIMEARLTIEPPAGRMAAERRAKDAALALRKQIIVEYRALGDVPRLARAVADFHTLVLEVSGNQTLTLMGQALQQIMEKHMSLIDADILDRETPETQLQRQRAGFRSQERLADFVEAGDGPGAEAHWRTHMLESLDYWLQGDLAEATVEILAPPAPTAANAGE